MNRAVVGLPEKTNESFRWLLTSLAWLIQWHSCWLLISISCLMLTFIQFLLCREACQQQLAASFNSFCQLTLWVHDELNYDLKVMWMWAEMRWEKRNVPRLWSTKNLKVLHNWGGLFSCQSCPMIGILRFSVSRTRWGMSFERSYLGSLMKSVDW